MKIPEDAVTVYIGSDLYILMNGVSPAKEGEKVQSNNGVIIGYVASSIIHREHIKEYNKWLFLAVNNNEIKVVRDFYGYQWMLAEKGNNIEAKLDRIIQLLIQIVEKK